MQTDTSETGEVLTDVETTALQAVSVPDITTKALILRKLKKDTRKDQVVFPTERQTTATAIKEVTTRMVTTTKVSKTLEMSRRESQSPRRQLDGRVATGRNMSVRPACTTTTTVRLKCHSGRNQRIGLTDLDPSLMSNPTTTVVVVVETAEGPNTATPVNPQVFQLPQTSPNIPEMLRTELYYQRKTSNEACRILTLPTHTVANQTKNISLKSSRPASIWQWNSNTYEGALVSLTIIGLIINQTVLQCFIGRRAQGHTLTPRAARQTDGTGVTVRGIARTVGVVVVVVLK